MKTSVVGSALLPFGVAKVAHQAQPVPCLVGLSLQHPPVHLIAQPCNGLLVTGARADAALRYAEAFLRFYALPAQVELQVELAVPLGQGLGSDAALALTVAQTLAQFYALPADNLPSLAAAVGLDTTDALAIYGAMHGGLLGVEVALGDEPRPSGLPVLVRQQPIAHPERHAWVFVLVLPRLAPGAALPDERGLLAQIARVSASSEDPEETGEQLFAAAAADDLATFARSLQSIESQTRQVLEQNQIVPALTTDDKNVLDFMRSHGTIAQGRCLTGNAWWGLIGGASASQVLRAQLRRYPGLAGGMVMAAIASKRS
ncbi:hypothetical protein [Candidatus Chloroploca asiatica]|uniref:GHMP kinase N-terminal domain-containing protein n=1 Tax=Candidatus Chloroploca asiatica TaxID=1506545 RepID=A0A2H3KY49_9CHLR|nr:hypothetical protein [Candidatus Chloroploca asiatica]PDV97281.1 hypothetical protein A9Q02_05115 [Candidatus Chloroploca asiatica]